MHDTLIHVLPLVAVLVLLGALIRAGRIDARVIGLIAPRGRWLLPVALFVAYTAAAEAVRFATGTVDVQPWRLSPAEAAIRAVGIVVLAPVAEEIIFRGALLAALRRRWSDATAIAAQALVFLLFHAPSLAGSPSPWLDGGQILLDAVVFGWVRVRSGSLFPSMGMHALGNAVAVVERLVGG